MILSFILLAMTLSIDAFGVGVAYGIKKIRIPLISKFLICFFSIFYSGLSMFLGSSLSRVLSPQFSKQIGICILLIMGFWIILQAIFTRKKKESIINPLMKTDQTLMKIVIKSLGLTIHVVKNPASGDVDCSGSIDIMESLMLGLALSIDALGAGIGSSLAGLTNRSMPLGIGMFQLVMLSLGTILGKKLHFLGKSNEKLIAILPGILLIILALIRFF